MSLRRDTSRGVAGGVLAGIAAFLKADPLLVRVLFAVGVIFTGGALLVGYVIAWALIPAADGTVGITLPRLGSPGRRWHLSAGVGLLVLSALLIFRELGIWWSDAFVWPLALVGAGLALLWSQTRASARPPELSPSGARLETAALPDEERGPASSVAVLYRGGFGIALVVGAALLFLNSADALGAARDAAFTATVSIVALALILAPFIWRLGRNLAAERSARIRSQERAEVAAHLHDSVLQTLTLMQKRSSDPREVAALARRQERELREWLADEGSGDDEAADRGFAAALGAAAAEVEDAHRVAIDVVAVGDCPLDERAGAVVAAAREALTNAAKFAPEGAISVYAEVTPQRIEAYVRDRGPGFDPEAVAADRRGIRESIVGRMRRHGGDATIAAVAGTGTEIALSLERGDR